MKREIAVLAGGCFWGMEELLRNFDGVLDTEVGYVGGAIANPTYEKHDGHAEAIQVVYDADTLQYLDLLKFFFQIHNPTTLNRQGNDVGDSYRSAIFYADTTQLQTAQKLIAQMELSGNWCEGLGSDKIVTELCALDVFYPAENYHQDYLQRNPNGYSCHYIRQNWVI